VYASIDRATQNMILLVYTVTDHAGNPNKFTQNTKHFTADVTNAQPRKLS